MARFFTFLPIWLALVLPAPVWSDELVRVQVAVVERLTKLPGAGPELSEQEKALLADAAEGRSSRVTLGEAALLASGVRDKKQQQRYLDRLDALEKEARRAVAQAKTPFAQGELLLKWMHAGPAKKYESHQDHLPVLLDDGKFNCVSATMLYTILGKRLGLDLRGRHLSWHIWSIQYDQGRSKEVETTSAQGFDGNAGPKPFKREFNEFGVVATLYRNQMARLSKEERFAEVLRAAAMAQALDPKDKNDFPDLQTAFHNWFVTLARKKQYGEAIGVIKIGLEAMPGNWTLITDRRQGYAIWAQDHRRQGRFEEAATLLATAVVEHADDDDLKLDAADQYLRWARNLVKQGDLPQAEQVLETAAQALPKSPGLRNELEHVRKLMKR